MAREHRAAAQSATADSGPAFRAIAVAAFAGPVRNIDQPGGFNEALIGFLARHA